MDPAMIVIGEGEGDRDMKIAGKAFFSVRTETAEPDRRGIAAGDLGFPEVAIETKIPSVHRVRTIVFG